MSRQFFDSEEYRQRNRSDAEFVGDCYRIFLMRDASEEEIAAWMAGQWNRTQVRSAFAQCEEFNGLIEDLFPNSQGEAARNFVTTMYLGFLDRLPDEGGLEYFANRFGNADTSQQQAREMARNLMDCEEFQTRQPSLEECVARLYEAFLGRSAGDEEIAYWVGEIQAGNLTLQDLIDTFADSEEFAGRLGRYFGGR